MEDRTLLAESPNAFVAHLKSRRKLTDDAWKRAVSSASKTQEAVIPVLSKLGLISEADLVHELASFYKVKIVIRKDFPTTPLFSDSLKGRFLRLHRVVPLIDDDQSGLVIAMADPGDESAVKALSFFSRRPVTRCVAALTDIEAAIENLYGDDTSAQNTPTTTGKALEEASIDDVDRLTDLVSEAPVIRLVNSLILKAVEQGASDIHIEPFEDRVRVRVRLDGMLREEEDQPRTLGEAITSRIKIMARLNIAERRLPQDGRIRYTARGKDIDIRVSTSPTVYGESVVLRVLDRSNLALDFGKLGFDDDVLAPTMELLGRPHGIILVTGPTGSGKTTTLYTALTQLNTPDKKILTVEDPVEFMLDGINQQPVQPQIGRSFASSLRSFLRQDPDIIMVGEIRDGETAQIAVQAALTGHLILSTLHTNNAASAMMRLLDMGVEDYLLTSTIAGVLGQRLVRCLCPDCKEAVPLSPSMMQKYFTTVPLANKTAKEIYRPKGCSACHGTGYRGRTMIVELLVVNEAICRLVLQKAETQDIQNASVENGMRTMYQHGLQKVLSGMTSLEEVLRVTQEA